MAQMLAGKSSDDDERRPKNGQRDWLSLAPKYGFHVHRRRRRTRVNPLTGVGISLHLLRAPISSFFPSTADARMPGRPHLCLDFRHTGCSAYGKAQLRRLLRRCGQRARVDESSTLRNVPIPGYSRMSISNPRHSPSSTSASHPLRRAGRG